MGRAEDGGGSHDGAASGANLRAPGGSRGGTPAAHGRDRSRRPGPLLTTPGLQNLDGPTSIALAQRSNDLAAAAVALHPERFQGFVALPTPAPQEAPRELERCVRELGLKGAMLHGRTRDKNLDHQDFWPLFERAEQLRVPLFIHPQIPQHTVRDVYYSGFSGPVDLAFSTFGLGWHYEAGIQFVRLVLAGSSTASPTCRSSWVTGERWCSFNLERLVALDRVAKLKRSVTARTFT